MKSKATVLLACLLFPWLANAQDADKYRCTYGDLERRVEIFREPGREVPCEVHYYKDTEEPGSDQVLWSASSQGGYCEQQTADFIARLEGWGWDCGVATSEPAEETTEEPDATDDTTALQPADDTQ